MNKKVGSIYQIISFVLAILGTIGCFVFGYMKIKSISLAYSIVNSTIVEDMKITTLIQFLVYWIIILLVSLILYGLGHIMKRLHVMESNFSLYNQSMKDMFSFRKEEHREN